MTILTQSQKYRLQRCGLYGTSRLKPTPAHCDSITTQQNLLPRFQRASLSGRFQLWGRG
jgi:hypothetical protein